ncbi:MAG: AI-2E family transporter [Clostridiales bacterium]|nr:AI-2E family transporter [Clostridiales bacterium]
MFFDNREKRKQLAKWVIGVIAACILIFLGVRYISSIAAAVSWLVHLVRPLLIGVVLALILNVPLGMFERRLFSKKPTPKKLRARRPLAIVLSLVLVFGIFVGVAVLVIPEFVAAVRVIASMLLSTMDQLAAFESQMDFSRLPFGEYLSRIDIDWLQLRAELELWFKQAGSAIMDRAAGVIGSVASSVIDSLIGFIFSIYVLANKEKLKRQVSRLIRVWLPEKFGGKLIHAARVSADIFRQFIAGQTTEAIILGSLCAVGMWILQIPYAPMVGALVGVMALIPYVGAFISTAVGAFMILTVSPIKALIFVVFLLALQQIEGNLIYPKVVGAKINLPAMWVLAAITVGGNLAGPIGMLLGVPIASAAYALLKEATDRREQAKMPADAPPDASAHKTAEKSDESGSNA